MGTWVAEGGVDRVISAEEISAALQRVWKALGPRRKVLALPPDYTRHGSFSGPILGMAYGHYGDAMTDIMPALGTHEPMSAAQWAAMFPGVPRSLMRVHDWRRDVVTIGEVPASYVRSVTGGAYDLPWPCQLNRLAWEGGHDLILSIGQVLPHEVIGMANHVKNLFVGIGGSAGINESHYIGALHGMERIMGRADTPLRRILQQGWDLFARHLPVVFIQTVVGLDADGNRVVRGLFAGDDEDCFRQAAELSRQVNITLLDEEPRRIVVYLEPGEFQSTWLGNKSIYRTRLAIANEGELVVLAPAVRTFGEDPEIDRLIRRYGYRRTPEVLEMVRRHADLRANLSAAAHLIHGSTEGRFRVVYCPGRLSRAEIEGVGYEYGDLDAMMARYQPAGRRDGWHRTAGGERFYMIRNPAGGLWAARGRFPAQAGATRPESRFENNQQTEEQSK